MLLIDGRPVLFRQLRPGLGEKPFALIKFRTMTACPPGSDSDELQRTTKLGVFLRSTSLDELPSLWNVLRGHMSLVGPRPLLMDYLEVYSPGHSLRHTVRPGLTGLAQVSGRNLLPWNEKLNLDLVYVQELGLWLDVKILARTASSVLSLRGINQADGSLMSRLTRGYDSE